MVLQRLRISIASNEGLLVEKSMSNNQDLIMFSNGTARVVYFIALNLTNSKQTTLFPRKKAFYHSFSANWGKTQMEIRVKQLRWSDVRFEHEETVTNFPPEIPIFPNTRVVSPVPFPMICLIIIYSLAGSLMRPYAIISLISGFHIYREDTNSMLFHWSGFYRLRKHSRQSCRFL